MQNLAQSTGRGLVGGMVVALVYRLAGFAAKPLTIENYAELGLILLTAILAALVWKE